MLFKIHNLWYFVLATHETEIHSNRREHTLARVHRWNGEMEEVYRSCLLIIFIFLMEKVAKSYVSSEDGDVFIANRGYEIDICKTEWE